MEDNQQVNDQAAPISDLNIWDTPSTPAPVSTPAPAAPVSQETTPPPAAPVTPPAPATPAPPATPPAGTPPVAEPKTDAQVAQVTEKIIEKYPEFTNDLSKQLFEAIRQGKTDEVYQYLAAQKKDYQTMSDMDVIKEDLKAANPKWSDKDIESEIRYKYGSLSLPQKKDLSLIDQNIDPDGYEKAVEFNDKVDEKELLLSRDARDARIRREDSKQTIEFPKLDQPTAESEKPLTQDEIDESNRKWEARVESEMPTLADLKFKVGDEEVTYKITDEEKASMVTYMKDFSGEKVAKDRGWIDADGNENVVKIAEDLLKLQHFEKIFASSGTQLKTLATKEVLADIKNVDLQTQQSSPQLGQDLGALIWS